jgi:hypothetical protein
LIVSSSASPASSAIVAVIADTTAPAATSGA